MAPSVCLVTTRNRQVDTGIDCTTMFVGGTLVDKNAKGAMAVNVRGPYSDVPAGVVWGRGRPQLRLPRL